MGMFLGSVQKKLLSFMQKISSTLKPLPQMYSAGCTVLKYILIYIDVFIDQI